MLRKTVQRLALSVALTAALLGFAPASPAAAACSETRGIFTISTVCNWNVATIYQDGRYFVYAVASSNKAVYTIYQRYRDDSTWSGWISLRGTVKESGVFVWFQYPQTIGVIGTDSNWWCNTLNGSQWTGWHQC
jgi:hypothetical protein